MQCVINIQDCCQKCNGPKHIAAVFEKKKLLKENAAYRLQLALKT